MNELNEERIQRWLDEKQAPPKGELSSAEEEALEAYRLLNNRLATDIIEDGLPYNFTINVTAKIQAHQQHISNILLYFILAALLIVGIAIVGILADFSNLNFVLTALMPYRYVFVFSAICIAAVLWAGEKLKHKMPNTHDV